MKIFISFIFFLFIITGCINESEDIKVETGTVNYIDLEGGFYGITGDKNNYDPVNLPAEYRIDGLKITFKYKVCKEQISFHMWGTMIELIHISKIN